jgi:hypothetical protein
VTALPHAIPVVIDGQIRLHVYRGPRLEMDAPLRRRQAIVLAAQLLNQVLMPEYPAGPDATCSRRRRNRGLQMLGPDTRMAENIGMGWTQVMPPDRLQVLVRPVSSPLR